VLWAVENSAGKISLLGHHSGNQPTKDQKYCFPTITIDLDDFGWSGRESKCMM
jgi:hypothetical protein